MRIRTSIRRLLLSVAAIPSATLFLATPAVFAQDASAAEVAATYTYIHTNAPPAECGCFAMNGGNGSFAFSLTHTFSVVGELGATTVGNVNSSGLDLTLANYLVGPRYSFRHFSRFTPFGQVLIGAAHTSGSLSPSSLGIGSNTSFAMTAGGGLDLNLTHRLALRLFQTDYFLTRQPNADNTRQNNFRFSTGIVIRFGSK
jgi:outer membrane immunogenic protein